MTKTNQSPIDLKELLGTITSLFLKNKKPETSVNIATLFDERFITQNLEIPETSYLDFMDYLEEQLLFKDVVQTKDELKILEFLVLQKERFLSQN